MCIALIKNIGVEIPSEDILKICFKNNPDGAGFAYCRNGKIIIKKGFFTFNGFYKALKESNINKEEPALIHFRVATHGKINIENCHPFPITNKFSNMTNPKIITDCSVMVHNGKLNIPITSSIYSDSMHLARSLFEFDRLNHKNFIDYIIRPTKKNKRGNRLGIINVDGSTEKYGSGWIEENGIWYSNDSYKENSTYKSKKIKKTTKNKKNIFRYCEKCKMLKQIVQCNWRAGKNGMVYAQKCLDCAINEGFIQCRNCGDYYIDNKNRFYCSSCSRKEKENNPFGGMRMENGVILFD